MRVVGAGRTPTPESGLSQGHLSIAAGPSPTIKPASARLLRTLLMPGWFVRKSVQSTRATAPLFNYVVPDQIAEKSLVSLNFASWNQIGKWLRRVEALRDAA